MARVLTCLTLQGFEWAFRKSYPTKIPRMEQGSIGTSGSKRVNFSVTVQYIQVCMSEIWMHKQLDRIKRICYLSPYRIRAVSPEPSLLAHTCSESRGTFRQKARSMAPLNGWACAVKICHDGMLEDTNSLDGAQLTGNWSWNDFICLSSLDGS